MSRLASDRAIGSAPAPAAVAWCGGEAGLVREILSHVLAEAGMRVVDDRDEASGDGGTVSVLVSPSAADWDEARHRGAPIVLVSSREPADDEVVEAVLWGADAVLHVDTAPTALCEAVAVVLAGGCALAPGQVRRLAAVARADRARYEPELTPREREILVSIARGEAVKQTARALGIATKTVENLQSRLFRKLGVRNRSQAVARAHLLGLLPAAP